MNVHKLCMNCMREQLNENGICSACGAIESEIKTTTKHLPMRSILKGKYLIGSVLGEGGFGITYVGYDLDLEIKVAIKEFCPMAISGREVADGASVVPFGADAAEQYEAEKEKFINEAKRLAKFRKLDGVVSVLDYFKENNTAYIVMDYIEGVTLKEHCKMLNKPMPWKTLLDMMSPIIRSLSEIHKAGIIHRDISPDNIMLSYDQRNVYLIDFGTARELNKGTMSAYEKGFYTPWEQISTKKSQGPWTDVYALCATMYHCLTGRKIPVVGDRYGDEAITLPSQYGIQVPEYIEQALVEGLALDPDNRIRSMEELEEKLYASKANEGYSSKDDHTNKITEAAGKKAMPQTVGENDMQRKQFVEKSSDRVNEEMSQIYSAVNMNSKHGTNVRAKIAASKVVWCIMCGIMMGFEVLLIFASMDLGAWDTWMMNYHIIYIDHWSVLISMFYMVFLILTACVWGTKGFRFKSVADKEPVSINSAMIEIGIFAIGIGINTYLFDIFDLFGGQGICATCITFWYIVLMARHNQYISKKIIIAEVGFWVLINVLFILSENVLIDDGWADDIWIPAMDFFFQIVIMIVTFVSLIKAGKKLAKVNSK